MMSNDIFPYHTFISNLSIEIPIYIYIMLALNCKNLQTSYSMNTLRYYGPHLWNGVDQTLKTKLSVCWFKNSYEQYLIYQYQYVMLSLGSISVLCLL